MHDWGLHLVYLRHTCGGHGAAVRNQVLIDIVFPTGVFTSCLVGSPIGNLLQFELPPISIIYRLGQAVIWQFIVYL